MRIISSSLLLTVSLLANPLNSQAPPQSPELLKVERPGFEAYAPRADDLARATEAAEQASREYQGYFGAAPARFAVVLFDDDAQRVAYSSEMFKARGLAVLHWPARTRRADGLAVWPGVGVILSDVPSGRARVGALFAGAGSALRVGDVVVSLNGAPVGSTRELITADARLPTGAEALLEVERDTRLIPVRLTKVEGNLAPSPQEAIMATVRSAPLVPSTRSTIAHEIGHTVLFASFPSAPPVWFHEGFAMLMEDSTVRAERRATVREAGERRIALGTLVTMQHPASGGPRVVEPGAQPNALRRPGEQTIVFRSDGANPAMFYGQSMSLLEYVAERRGKRFVGELAEKLAAGQPLDAALGTDDLATLERDWAAWLAAGPGQRPADAAPNRLQSST
jgi:hypothetical protein